VSVDDNALNLLMTARSLRILIEEKPGKDGIRVHVPWASGKRMAPSKSMGRSIVDEVYAGNTQSGVRPEHIAVAALLRNVIGQSGPM